MWYMFIQIFSAESHFRKNICDLLRNLVPIVQSWKDGKHPWRSVTFSEVAGFWTTLIKVTLIHGCFWRFFNCTNGTKSRNASKFCSHMFDRLLNLPLYIRVGTTKATSLESYETRMSTFLWKIWINNKESLMKPRSQLWWCRMRYLLWIINSSDQMRTSTGRFIT